MKALWLLLLVVFVGCDAPDQATESPRAERASGLDTPQGVASAYYDALWSFRFENAYDLVSSEDRAAMPLESFQRRSAARHDKVAGAKLAHAIHDTRVDGDRARVYVDVTKPDETKVRQTLLEEFVKAGEVPSKEALDARRHALFKSGEYPTVTTREEVLLVREGGIWRVDLETDEAGGPVPTPE